MAKSSRAFWAVATVVFLTLLLRPPLAAIGPLLPQIQKTLDLNSAELGLLTSTPVLCFGVGAFAGPWVLRRLGLSRAFSIILILLVITMITRVWFGFWYLVVATIIMGIGIAVSNVLFPTLIQAEFPDSVPKLTATYTTMLSGFSAVASGIAIPVAAALGSWQLALALLGVPGVLGLVAWRRTVSLTHPTATVASSASTQQNLWRHPLTWAIAGFFGLQSSNFYVMLNWLPSMLIDKGMPALNAGGVVALMSMIGIPVGMVITANLKRIRNLTAVVLAISVVTSIGLAMFILGPAMAVPAAILTGVGLSSSFPLSLAMIGMKGSTQQITTSLSSISQGTGYLFSAAVVFVAGLTYDWFHSWIPAMLGLIASALIQSLAGIYAVRHKGI